MTKGIINSVDTLLDEKLGQSDANQGKPSYNKYLENLSCNQSKESQMGHKVIGNSPQNIMVQNLGGITDVPMQWQTTFVTHLTKRDTTAETVQIKQIATIDQQRQLIHRKGKI